MAIAQFQPSWYKPPKAPKKGIPGTITNGVLAPSSPSVPYASPTSQASSVTLGNQQAVATPDIRDPQYWLDAANIKNYYGTQKAQYGEQERSDKEALARAQKILGVNPGGDIQAGLDTAGNVAGGKGAQDIRMAEEGANKAGLFYSGILGRNIGNLRTSYAQQNEGLTSENTGRTNLRNIALGSLETEYGAGGIKERQSAIDALARQQARDVGVAAPTAATSTAAVTAPALSPMGQLAASQGGTGFAGLKKNEKYRVASNGKLQIQNSNGTWRNL